MDAIGIGHKFGFIVRAMSRLVRFARGLVATRRRNLRVVADSDDMRTEARFIRPKSRPGALAHRRWERPPSPPAIPKQSGSRLAILLCVGPFIVSHETPGARAMPSNNDSGHCENCPPLVSIVKDKTRLVSRVQIVIEMGERDQPSAMLTL